MARGSNQHLKRGRRRRGTPSSFNSICEVGHYFSRELDSFHNSSSERENEESPILRKNGVEQIIRVDSSLLKTGESTAERLAEKKPLVLPLMRSHILQREREASHVDSIKNPRGHSRTSTVSPVQLTPLNHKKGNCFKKLHRILQEANSKQASTRSVSNHSIIEFHLNQEDEKLY